MASKHTRFKAMKENGIGAKTRGKLFIAQSGFGMGSTDPAKLKKWLEEKRAAEKANGLARRLTIQPELPMGQPNLILCPGCFGLGCNRCRKQGVIEGSVSKEETVYSETECTHCYGVGRVSTIKASITSTKMCPKCSSIGRVVNAEK